MPDNNSRMVGVLTDFCSVGTGRKDLKDKVDDGAYPFFVRSKNIERIDSYASDGEAILTPGDGEVGKVFHYVYGKFNFHQRVYRIGDFRGVDGKYLYYYLCHNFPKEVRKHSVRATVNSLRMPIFTGMRVDFPPLTEQKRIASILSTWDAAIEANERLLANSERRKKWLMQVLLTGEKRLPGFEGELMDERLLGDIVTFHKGRGLPKSEIVVDGDAECIHYGQLFSLYGERIDDVIGRTKGSGKLVLSKKYDVLMPTSDVTPKGLATASCLEKDDVVLGGDILIIRPDKEIFGPYLSYYLNNSRKQILKRVSGSTVYHFYASDAAKISVCLPSKKEQVEISNALSASDEIIDANKKIINVLKVEKKGLMQRLIQN